MTFYLLLTALTAMHNLSKDLVHLKEVFLTFLCGALQTWLRFLVEYAPGDLTDSLTASEWLKAFMSVTNDANEGVLGSLRHAL